MSDLRSKADKLARDLLAYQSQPEEWELIVAQLEDLLAFAAWNGLKKGRILEINHLVDNIPAEIFTDRIDKLIKGLTYPGANDYLLSVATEGK